MINGLIILHKMNISMKKSIFLFICACCIVVLPQCSKVVYSDDEDYTASIIPIDPLFDYSSIAFIARITHNSADWSLCVMDKSGNNMQKIVDMTVSCQKPVRSHCGTKLLFTAVKFDYWNDENNTFHSSYEYGLYVINTDGTGLTLIDRIDQTESGSFGASDWSPDNNHIVYVKYTFYTDRIEDKDLILYNISNNKHTILKTEGRVCSPKFSPDGKQIAYCTSVENNHRIYKMDINGKNNQLIISNGASPKWSPQGDKIAYSSSGEAGSSQIFVANADGSNQRQQTHTISPQRWPGPWAPDGNGNPQWTPDGSRIVYVSHENEKSEIFIMNANGSNQTRLTKAEFQDNDPEITPCGKYILFSSVRSEMIGGGNPGILIMTLDGKNQRVLSRTGIYPIACK